MTSRKLYGWMWGEACEMLERAERLHRQFFRLAAPPLWEPPIDIYETADALWLLVALPGVPPETVEISHDAAAVIVAGQRPLPALSDAVIHRLEIPHGRFERRIELPPGRFQIAQHELANGCLVLGLRKF